MFFDMIISNIHSLCGICIYKGMRVLLICEKANCPVYCQLFFDKLLCYDNSMGKCKRMRTFNRQRQYKKNGKTDVNVWNYKNNILT